MLARSLARADYYIDGRSRVRGERLGVILVRLMEISQKVRCGFLRWRNERGGHGTLNIAVDLSAPSLSRTQMRRNCLLRCRIRSSRQRAASARLYVRVMPKPSEQASSSLQLVCSLQQYASAKALVVPRGTVEYLPASCCGVIVKRNN